ncbi:PA3496 family putative envelope integrity protein [Marinobacterium nitratireducens]|uniref:PA3496 family putative envelope integrity protein n=1 Tax=Marinobacterium nitratireducens TaxID=518897 RepID=UPI0035711B32
MNCPGISTTRLGSTITTEAAHPCRRALEARRAIERHREELELSRDIDEEAWFDD